VEGWLVGCTSTGQHGDLLKWVRVDEDAMSGRYSLQEIGFDVVSDVKQNQNGLRSR
jgi:hypothetical protein